MRINIILFGIISAVLAGCTDSPASLSSGFAITCSAVFDGDKMHQGQAVWVENGLIRAILPEQELPDNLETHRACGQTLMPGLIDAHTHVFGPALTDALRFGVTTELDMFTSSSMLPEARRKRESLQAQIEADLYSAGTLVTAPGGHGTQYGIQIDTITSPDQANAFVKARIEEGSDYIKIVYNAAEAPFQFLNSIDRPTLISVIEAAHAQDKMAVVHVMNLVSAQHAIAAGADGLVHNFMDTGVDDSLITAMKQSNAFMIPTLSVLASISGVGDAKGLGAKEDNAPYLNQIQKGTLDATFPAGAQGNYSIAAKNVQALHQAGIDILAGSDAPNPGTAHGISAHHELMLLVDAGLSPAEALRSATSLTAKRFGLSDRGRIAEGMRADLLLVQGDPTTDITATQRITTLWKNGQKLDRQPIASSTGQAFAIQEEGGLLSDFEQEGFAASSGLSWQPTSDQRMGGSSEVTLEQGTSGAQQSAGALKVIGEIKPGFPWPWSGTIYFPGETPMAPVDMSHITELSFWAKGDTDRLRVMVFSGSLAGPPAQKTIEISKDWALHRVQFSNFPGVKADRIMALSFSAPMDVTTFEFQLDNVSLK